jgi:prevent-host-death family protein
MIAPMRTVNVHDAKTHLSTLLAEVAAGEEVVIARSGRPVARLVPYTPVERPIGIDNGKLTIAEDFDQYIPPEFEPYA